MKTFRLPHIQLVCLGNCYAWAMHHQTLGLRALSDSKQTIIAEYKRIICLELDLQPDEVRFLGNEKQLMDNALT